MRSLQEGEISMLRNDAHIRIGTREVGAGCPLFVIAEIGLNHGGSPEKALRMVDEAADAGASAVKLQTLEATMLVSAGCPAPAHVQAESLSEFFATFELDEPAHRAVAERARARGLAFVATPLSLDGVDLLARVGVDAIKIASGDLTWDALVDRAARTGKPLIISTGMATIGEVSNAVATARLAGANEIALLHCVSAYPVPRGSENLRAINTLSRSFETPVGLSDHASDTFAVPMAVALGASIYERHLVLEGDAEAVDAAVSSTPRDLRAVVDAAARAQTALGSGEKGCDLAEMPNLVPSRRALYAAHNLTRGQILEADDVVALRPGSGLPANQVSRLIGLPLKCDVAFGQPITFNHVGVRTTRRTA